MADKLVVKNYGPINEATLDIKKTTVLIGPQGSGKSTLAKLVAVFADKSLTASLLRAKKSISSGFLVESYFEENLTKISYINDRYSVNFNTETDSFLVNLNEHLNNETKQNLIQNLAYSELIKHMGFNEYSDFLQRIPKNQGSNIRTIGENIFPKLFQDVLKNKAKYLPAERFLISATSGATWGLMSNNIALPSYVLEFGSSFEMAKRNLNQLSINYLKIDYLYENGQDTIQLENGKKIKLSASASGFQAVVPLQLVIEDNFELGQTNFIVEEPELNLFPITQKNLIQYLADRCTKNENQLMLTTHSPYVLSSLNLLVFAYQTAKKHPDKIKEISQIVPQASWLNPEEFSAYYVDEGTVRSIINPNTGLITENELDGVSDLIGDEFDALLNIYTKDSYAITT